MPFKKHLLFIIAVINWTANIHSQPFYKEWADTIRLALKEKPGFTGYFDSRTSFTQNYPVSIFGAFGGLSYGRTVDLGLAYYNTMNEKSIRVIRNPGLPWQDTINRTVGLGYVCVRAEFTFYRTRWWEFYLPIHAGIGSGSIHERWTKNGANYHYQSQSVIMPVECGVSGIFLLTRWFGIAGGVGYRLNLTAFRHFNSYSNIYYSLGFSLRTGTIYRMMKGAFKKGNKK